LTKLSCVEVSNDVIAAIFAVQVLLYVGRINRTIKCISNQQVCCCSTVPNKTRRRTKRFAPVSSNVSCCSVEGRRLSKDTETVQYSIVVSMYHTSSVLLAAAGNGMRSGRYSREGSSDSSIPIMF
jgi:hypothetical protein